MKRRINLRTPAKPGTSSLDPAEAQWLESVSRALFQHIAFLKQLKPLNLPAASAPDRVAADFPSAEPSAPQLQRFCWIKRWPCLVTIPRHLNFNLLAHRAAPRA